MQSEHERQKTEADTGGVLVECMPPLWRWFHTSDRISIGKSRRGPDESVRR